MMHKTVLRVKHHMHEQYKFAVIFPKIQMQLFASDYFMFYIANVIYDIVYSAAFLH